MFKTLLEYSVDNWLSVAVELLFNMYRYTNCSHLYFVSLSSGRKANCILYGI